MVIMTAFAAVVVYAAIVALRTRKPRLKAPEAVAGEAAIPATPTAAAVVDSLKRDSARRRH